MHIICTHTPIQQVVTLTVSMKIDSLRSPKVIFQHLRPTAGTHANSSTYQCALKYVGVHIHIHIIYPEVIVWHFSLYSTISVHTLCKRKHLSPSRSFCLLFEQETISFLAFIYSFLSLLSAFCHWRRRHRTCHCCSCTLFQSQKLASR